MWREPELRSHQIQAVYGERSSSVFGVDEWYTTRTVATSSAHPGGHHSRGLRSAEIPACVWSIDDDVTAYLLGALA